MAAPVMQLRIFHRNFSRTAKDCTRTGKNLRNFRKLGKSLAVLGILELSWQGLKSTGVSVRALLIQFLNATGAEYSVSNIQNESKFLIFQGSQSM